MIDGLYIYGYNDNHWLRYNAEWYYYSDFFNEFLKVPSIIKEHGCYIEVINKFSEDKNVELIHAGRFHPEEYTMKTQMVKK